MNEVLKLEIIFPYFRFLQTAEMLKPPMPTTSHNEELIEYFPHVVFLQNKTRYTDFTQNSVSMMQVLYKLKLELSNYHYVCSYYFIIIIFYISLRMRIINHSWDLDFKYKVVSVLPTDQSSITWIRAHVGIQSIFICYQIPI